jgi:hypothetical protein
MGDDQFDQLARTLAKPLSRRQAVKILAATTATGILGLAGAGTAEAGRCRKNGHKCRQNYECCSFYCNPATAKCQCRPGDNLCSHTGLCVSCPPNSTFNSTTCTCDCNTGTSACGNQCCPEGVTCCPANGYYGPHCADPVYGC